VRTLWSREKRDSIAGAAIGAEEHMRASIVAVEMPAKAVKRYGSKGP